MKTRLINKTCSVPKCNNTQAFKAKAVKNCYKHRDEDGDLSIETILIKRRIKKDLKKMEENPYDYMAHKQMENVS